MAVGQHSDVPEDVQRAQSSLRWATTPNPQWMTFKEVLAYMRVSRGSLDKLVETGQLPAYRFGGGAPGHGLRFKREDVESKIFVRVRPKKPKPKGTSE